MSKARRLSLLATAGWLSCFVLLARMYAVAGPDDRTVLGVVVIVLLVGSGWLTGRAATARRRGE